MTGPTASDPSPPPFVCGRSAPGSRRLGAGALPAWIGALATAALAITALLAASGAQASDAEQDDLKAAFALNFAKFSDWPARRFPLSGGTFSVCQLRGSQGLRRALRALEGRTVQGYPVEFRQLENLAEAPTCMLLFAAGKPPVLLPGDAVLTIGDGPDFARLGGMIGFVQDGARLRFEVNLGAAQRAGIGISSQVLSLAATVIEPAPALPPMFRQATAADVAPSALQPAQDPRVGPLDGK